MQTDKIKLILGDMVKVKSELKELKKSIKAMEKIEEEDYLSFKGKVKELKEEMKEIESDILHELSCDDKEYISLKEMKMKKEEELAQFKQKLFELLNEELPKNGYTKFEIPSDEGAVLVQAQAEMKVYLNGKGV